MTGESLYKHRFDDDDRDVRQRLWRVLVDEWLSDWLDPNATVLDLGASDCAFINNVTAERRIAVDIDPGVADATNDGIEVIVGTLQSSGLAEECDVIMASNVFEHLPDVDTLLDLLGACHRALKPGGRLLILQPNFRYTIKQFYDYLDHHLPLTERSMAEALAVSGFAVERSIPRFLPYSVKNQRIDADWALRAYLRMPLLWRLFGRQMFIVARKSHHP